MNAHVTFPNSLSLPQLKGMVQSLSESASTAVANFDTLTATPKQRLSSSDERASASALTPMWMPPTSATSTSSLRKGGALALVVLVHVLAAYALTHLPPQVTDIVMQPLQVAVIAAPQSTEEKPLPPPTIPQQSNITLPVEPVFIIAAEPSATAITVETPPVESTTSDSATATPKVVSTVEYIREPQPKYPPAARALKQRGTVMLRVLVDGEGHAREVNLHRSSGYRLLDDAARSAVLNALFKPYSENGRSRPVYVFVPIEFGAV
jgi:periplasmic protein TonB